MASAVGLAAPGATDPCAIAASLETSQHTASVTSMTSSLPFQPSGRTTVSPATHRRALAPSGGPSVTKNSPVRTWKTSVVSRSGMVYLPGAHVHEPTLTQPTS